MKRGFGSIWDYMIVMFLVLSANQTLAQNTTIDSLINIVQKGKQDTTTVAALNALSSELLQTEELDKAKAYADQAIALAEQLDFKKGKAYAQKNVGLTYYYEGNYLKVLEYWTQSLESFELAQDSLGIANLTNNLGAVYRDQGGYAKAITYYLRSLRISEKLNDTLRIATALMNIGNVYGDNKEYDKALENYNETQPYLKSLNEPQITAGYLMSVGEIYGKQKDYKKALTFLEEALKINKNTSEYAHNLVQLGNIESEKGNKSKARLYFNSAYSIAKNNNQKYDMVSALVAKGNIYEAEDYKGALIVFKEAESIAQQLDLNYELRDIYNGMAKTYANLNDYSNAFKYQELYLAKKDTLFNLETDDKIRGLQFDFDLEKKQDEIGLLEQDAQISELLAKRQKYVIYGTVLGLILVFVLAIGAYKRERYVKKTNKIIEEEKNRSEKLLLNILPEETALELKENGKVAAKKFESVTVMFTDFKGFTRYSESLSPEELVQAVDYFFSKFDAVMDKYDLEKIKTIGDAYMCAGGLPFPTDDHHLKMVQAGFEIAQIMEEAKKNTDGGIMNIDVRIGINTGPVVAGVVGTRKFAYDIWGDAVNVASRMESMSEPGKINVSKSTYLLIRDTYDCEHRGQIHVKNKGMMDMYFVHGLKEELSSKAKKAKVIHV